MSTDQIANSETLGNQKIYFSHTVGQSLMSLCKHDSGYKHFEKNMNHSIRDCVMILNPIKIQKI